MQTHLIEKKLITIVRDLLTDSGESNKKEISLHTSLQSGLGIDSIGRAELYHRIEKYFNIQLSQHAMENSDSLFDILNEISIATTDTKFQKTDSFFTYSAATQLDASTVETLVDVLAMHATAHPDQPHIYLPDENNNEIISYGKLFNSALIIANALQNQEIEPGDKIALMLPTCPEFFYAFFGILLANCTPVPIYPPLRVHQLEAYAKQEAKILNNAEARMLITFDKAIKLGRLLQAFVPHLKQILSADTLLSQDKKATLINSKSTHAALIQYTSGSTNTPKGVFLSHQNLLSNIRAYGSAIQVSPQDKVVSWLPLYHDLGLIGNWLGSLYFGIPLIAFSPLSFLNRPEKWLWAIHQHKATISAGPNFAYDLCIKKIDTTKLEGLDLSTWRLAINGAETVQPKTIREFTTKFSAYGFKAETMLPVYGLAETSLGLTASPLGRPPRIDNIDRKSFEEKKLAISTIKTSSVHCLEFVSCGLPLSGQEIRIVDNQNNMLSDRMVGHLQFRGPSSMRGYYNNPEATQEIFHNGWWDSGDLAYKAEGEIFITGRKKDLIIKAGRNIYPSEIETVTASISEIRRGCVIAFGIQDHLTGTDKIIIVAETNQLDNQKQQTMIERIKEAVVSAVNVSPDEINLVPPHTIPKTSSGKLQRSICKKMYLEKSLKQSSIVIPVIRLGLKWLALKTWQSIKKFGKVIYTFYMAIFVFLTLPPLWMMVKILKRPSAARLIKGWVRSLCFVSFCPITINGKENISENQKPAIFTANHTSYLDIILLTRILPKNVRFVGKQELFKIPILRTFLNKLEHISVRRNDQTHAIEDMNKCKEVLAQGDSIFIFPEGTIHNRIGLRSFKLGAFKLAVESNIPICPIAINGTRNYWPKKKYLFTPGKIILTICDFVYPKTKDWQEINRLKNKIYMDIANHCGEPTWDIISSDDK